MISTISIRDFLNSQRTQWLTVSQSISDCRSLLIAETCRSFETGISVVGSGLFVCCMDLSVFMLYDKQTRDATVEAGAWGCRFFSMSRNSQINGTIDRNKTPQRKSSV